MDTTEQTPAGGLEHLYYVTTTICPECEKLLPGEVKWLGDGVFEARNCPEHGYFKGLVCADRQEKALERLIAWKINLVPLVLAVEDINDWGLGDLATVLLTRSSSIKPLIISMMTYAGRYGSSFSANPGQRLTITRAFDSVRVSKCSCQHLLPDGVVMSSCGYYSYQPRFDERFISR
jgi:hypothetical protein